MDFGAALCVAPRAPWWKVKKSPALASELKKMAVDSVQSQLIQSLDRDCRACSENNTYAVLRSTRYSDVKFKVKFKGTVHELIST